MGVGELWLGAKRPFLVWAALPAILGPLPLTVSMGAVRGEGASQGLS